MSINGKSNRMTLKEAIQLRTDGKYQDAETLFARLLADNPNDALINYHFAWLYDNQGKEQAAIPYYIAAIDNGLSGQDLRGALLGLGSTYRTLGEYQKSAQILQQGIDLFPNANEFAVFMAMTQYNLGESKPAVGILLNLLLKVTDDEDIRRFKRAIALYAEDLDRTWLS